MRQVHAVHLLADISRTYGSREKITNCYHVAEHAENAKIVLARFQTLSSRHQRDEDGRYVRNGQEDNTSARESIESSRRPEIDQTQQDLADHEQHHRVKWDIKFAIDLLPPM